MGSTNNIIDICSDDELDEVDVIAVKVEPGIEDSMQPKNYHKSGVAQNWKLNAYSRREDSVENKSSNALSTSQSVILDQKQSPIDTSLSSTSPICPAPVCRQFWKSGNYEDETASRSTLPNGKNYLNIHPKFLHSNATSHKWAFGAIAELLDNAVDEIQNGATCVIVDKTANPRDGSSALLIQDDGGGMDPEAMRRCMSFGFSDKKSKSTIGQYGNGFKTSSMRLGADVIVFSRHVEKEKLTQSIGLLSYTFLTQTGHDRIVVPMVDYEFNASTNTFDMLQRYDKEHFMSNLSMLLQWSPYSSEAELMKQFDDIGHHGTKVIVYSLWLNDEGATELDFDSDLEDIHIRGGAKSIETGRSKMAKSEQHLANQLLHSLRAYLSVLYLRMPKGFHILLRGLVVQHHNIANDLKYPEFIVYKPQSGGLVEGTILTTIGFLKEAPHVNIHGFNVYHKNRLILPFWHVVNFSDSRGRGVVGVLEANFIEPTHNKQDFEKTSVFQKLETRLKEMTWEYWDYHCGLIGYLPKKKPPTQTPSQGSSDCVPHHGLQQPVVLNESYAAIVNSFEGKLGLRKGNRKGPAYLKRKEQDNFVEPEMVKRQAGIGTNIIDSTPSREIQAVTPAIKLEDQEAMHLLQENRKLLAQCLESEKREKELDFKATRLRSELVEIQRVYARLLREAQLLDKVKEETNVDRVVATRNGKNGT